MLPWFGVAGSTPRVWWAPNHEWDQHLWKIFLANMSDVITGHEFDAGIAVSGQACVIKITRTADRTSFEFAMKVFDPSDQRDARKRGPARESHGAQSAE